LILEGGTKLDTEVRDEDATGSLAVVEIADNEYETVYDVPCVLMNRTRAGMQYEGEVVLSGTAEVDDARFQELLDVGLTFGQKVGSMEYSPYGSVLIYFSPDSGATS
jgi:hypothetical protein